jgi:serine/threonine protein kinase
MPLTTNPWLLSTACFFPFGSGKTIVPHPDTGRASKTFLGKTPITETFKAIAKGKFNVVVKIIREKGREQCPNQWKRWTKYLFNLQSHPNLTSLGLVETQSSLSFVCLEADSSLEDFIEEIYEDEDKKRKEVKKQEVEQLDWETRGAIVRDVAAGMNYLHEMGFYHGSLKPSNILLFGKCWKISDFVNYTRVSGDQWADSTGATDRRHESPEHIQNLTTASDVFSFGILLFELITQKRTYPHHNKEQKFVTLANVVALPADTDIPDGVIALINRCLEPSPDQRPSFHEILEELNTIVFR